MNREQEDELIERVEKALEGEIILRIPEVGEKMMYIDQTLQTTVLYGQVCHVVETYAETLEAHVVFENPKLGQRRVFLQSIHSLETPKNVVPSR